MLSITQKPSKKQKTPADALVGSADAFCQKQKGVSVMHEVSLACDFEATKFPPMENPVFFQKTASMTKLAVHLQQGGAK